MAFSTDFELDELMQRIHAHVLHRRVRSLEYFADFDRLRCGRCTEANFARAVTNMGLNLPDAELQVLSSTFIEEGPRVSKPQVVNYREFCKAIDEIFANGELQENMRSTVLSPSPGASVR